MDTLIEQLKAFGFDGSGGYYIRNSACGWVLVQPIGGRVSLSVNVLGVGQIDRWFPATVAIEEIEAFITRACRLIAEWDTCEISFNAPSILS